jgi:hypothetical protein
VQANSPMSVSWVAAFGGGVNDRAAVISAEISAVL